MTSAADHIAAMPQLPQAQYDLTTQLDELHAVATKLGLYDAADYIGSHATRVTNAVAAERIVKSLVPCGPCGTGTQYDTCHAHSWHDPK